MATYEEAASQCGVEYSKFQLLFLFLENTLHTHTKLEHTHLKAV